MTWKTANQKMFKKWYIIFWTSLATAMIYIITVFDRYRNNNESQRSMDYTSIESEENTSVIKYNTIETIKSLEEKYVKPDTAENFEKGEAYIGQTP